MRFQLSRFVPAFLLPLAVGFGTTGVTSSVAVAADDLFKEEMTVTARRREESIQDIPVSVSAFGEGDIVDRQLRTVEDVARFTPGLSFAKAFGRTTERPVIRGMGNVLAGVQFGVESGTAYFVDGLYYPGDLQSLNLTNLERVEVVRGPQSALYGRNTYAGAINFVTKGPRDEFESDIAVRYGEDADAQILATIAGPLIKDRLSGELGVRYYTFDGEWTNAVTAKTVGDEETTSVNGVLDFTPVENISFRLRGAYQQDRDGTRAFFLQPAESNNCYPGTRSNAAWSTSNTFGGVTDSTNNNQYFCGEVSGANRQVSVNDGPDADGVANLTPGIANQPTPGVPSFIVPGFPGGDNPYDPAQGVAFSGVDRDLTYVNLSGNWDMMGSGYDLIGSIAFRNDELTTGSDSDHSSVNLASPFAGASDLSQLECILCASEIDDATDVTMELRIESPADDRKLTWMLGGFYYDQEIDGSDIVWDTANGGAPATTVTGVQDTEQTTNIAAFGAIEYSFVDSFSMGLELRWFDEEKQLTEGKDQPTPTFDGTVSFSEVAPRVLANWGVTDNAMLYAIYAKGYKPGGLNGVAGEGVGAPTYDQEEADTYEIGVKSNLADNRVMLNLALFYNKLDKIQLTTPLASGGGQLTSIVTNQGDGDITGLELEFGWVILDNLNFSASYALADTEFTSGCDEFQWTLTSGGGILNDAANCAGNNVNGQGNGSIVGNAFPLSSKNQFSATLDWRQQLSGELEFFTNVDYTWEDKKPIQVHNEAWVPSASLVNGRIGINSDRWEVAIYGRNLLDEDAPSMVTRWLQEPNFFGRALASTAGAGAPAGSCPTGTCSTSWPRAFFGDLRRGRNFGIEAAYRFGGSR